MFSLLLPHDAPASGVLKNPSERRALQLMNLAARVELDAMDASHDAHSQVQLTRSEYTTYSGVGAIVCRFGAVTRASTAFLVGGFDIAVTVAHTFEYDGAWASPDDCLYTTAGPRGQIRERIALTSVKTQWRQQPETFGVPTADFAVVRLSRPVRYARRTLPLTKFASAGAPVMLVGFGTELGAGALKQKSRGTVYRRQPGVCAPFAHDIDSRGLAAGAPLIDVRDGVVIGIHTRLRPVRSMATISKGSCAASGNAMIPMNEWLERTLRAEIASSADTATHE